MPLLRKQHRQKYEHNDILAYCGDWADILPGLPECACVVTDPPYNEVNRKTGGLRKIDKGIADSASVDCKALATALASKATGSIYVWCGTEQVSDLRAAFVVSGLTTRACVWEKSNPSPMNGQRLWLSSIELCVFARKPFATFNRHCKSPVWRGPTQRSKIHPTQKPVWLIKEQIEASTNAGDLVIDPFMGSGTTAIACLDLGRRFIGVDICPEFFDNAIARIKSH